MLESVFQGRIIKRLELEFPGCLVQKNDSGYRQGITDLLILFGPKWAALEVKRSADAPTRPNQAFYVELLNEMSYAAFIFPENEEEIFDELHTAIGFPDRRPARSAQSLESGMGKLRRR